MQQNVEITGNLYVEGSEITGLMNTNTSDKRLKKDFEKISDALEKIKTLSGYTFSRIEDKYVGRRYTGLIAQEVQDVLPEAIAEYEHDGASYLSLAYGNMMGLVVEAIKELSTQVSALGAKINT